MRHVSRRSPAWLLFGGLLVISSVLIVDLAAQGRGGGQPRPPAVNQPDDPLLRGFRWRSIGPVGQGARIDDFAVDEKNPSTYYIGYAVSGIWKTVNNGTTFEPIFSTYGSASIADLALAPSDPNILYVATGEANNRQTTSYGDGMYKSTDAGKTFTNIGLTTSQSLGRVIVHPKDPNTVWVAVGGHLYGENPERGVYMTTDGGKTWNKTLYIDERTSATEIIIDPANPLILWASMYQRERTAWGFNGGGAGSGLYQSVDGGKTWKKQTGNGLPNGTLGRIALDICKTNPNVLYAQIEVAQDKEVAGATPAATTPAAAPAAGAGGGRGGRGGRGGAAGAGAGAAGAAGAGAAGAGAGGAGAGGAGAGGAAPAAFQGGGGGGRGQQGPPNPQLDGIWKSIDHGKTWQFMTNENQRPMYFSQIRVDPNDANTVYVGGVNSQKSTDGGKTFFSIETQKGHVDNHAIWIDPLNSKHVMYGDDGGLDVSWDGAVTFESVRLTGTGLAYHSSVGMGHPYMVCTGLQDNGSWCGPSSTRTGGIHMWDWMSVGGGDGFQNAIDPTDENIFYTESQNAGIERYNLSTGQTTGIGPRSTMNDPSCAQTGRGGGGGGGGRGGGASNMMPVPAPCTNFAHNWNSPIMLSPHNPQTVLLGGNRLFISRNRGETWTMTQEMGKKIDLTQRQIMGVSYALPGCGRGAGPGVPCILSKNDGYVANEYGTMTEVAESPLTPGILWTGTDDGNIQVSKDGGNTWTEVGKNIPGVNHEYYVSGLEASWFDAGTAYAALDGHRNDDLKPYIFKTTDYGQTWKSVSGNLPAVGNVNSIRQDPVNRNLLFAPTELGFYISLNDGQSWSRFMPNLPVGRMDEVMVHPREHDLILSSHSFSVWILDDISSLEQMTATGMGQDATLFKPRDAVEWKNDIAHRTEVPGEKFWEGEIAPRGTAIAYYLKSAATDVKVSITATATGQAVYTCSGDKTAGLNRFVWGLTTDQQAAGGGGGFGGGGGGGFGAGGGGGAPAPAPPTGTISCSAVPAAGGRGGGGGGGGRGGGAGGIQPGVFKVTLSVDGKDVGSQTFKLLEDIWLGEK